MGGTKWPLGRVATGHRAVYDAVINVPYIHYEHSNTYAVKYKYRFAE